MRASAPVEKRKRSEEEVHEADKIFSKRRCAAAHWGNESSVQVAEEEAVLRRLSCGSCGRALSV